MKTTSEGRKMKEAEADVDQALDDLDGLLANEDREIRHMQTRALALIATSLSRLATTLDEACRKGGAFNR